LTHRSEGAFQVRQHRQNKTNGYGAQSYFTERRGRGTSEGHCEIRVIANSSESQGGPQSRDRGEAAEKSSKTLEWRKDEKKWGTQIRGIDNRYQSKAEANRSQAAENVFAIGRFSPTDARVTAAESGKNTAKSRKVSDHVR
jgi:hypothetical protein